MGYKLTWVYIGQTKVRPSGWGWWQPWANTVAYYPLTSTTTVNDQTNNWHDWTNNWVAFGTYAGVDCAYFDRSSYISVPDSPELRWWDAYTISLWYNYDGNGVTAIDFYSKWKDTATGRMLNRVILGSNPYLQTTMCASNEIGGYMSSSVISWWHNWLVVRSAPNTLLYIDGQLAFSWTQTSSYTNTDAVLIWAGTNWSTTDYYVSWHMSNVIVENAARTAQEILDYYNNTKSNYWIS